MKRGIKLQYNSPVVLSFALAGLVVLFLDYMTRGASTAKFFCVYHCPLTDI